MPDTKDKIIASLEARIAALEGQLQPKPEPAEKPPTLEDFGLTRDPFGIVRDGKGKPIRNAGGPAPRADGEDARRVELTAKFEKMTAGLWEDEPHVRVRELEQFIEDDGDYRPPIYRDPTGIVRNRDGTRYIPGEFAKTKGEMAAFARSVGKRKR